MDKFQGQTFNIYILGDMALSNTLAVLQGRTIKNRKVEVKLISNIQDATDAHILIISDLGKHNLYSIIGFCQKHQILTISEHSGWANKGICINFFINRESSISFEINAESLKQSGLTANSMLLDFARLIE
jgi:hypothetical protein